jgi:DNA-binding response OmpR family regulator
VQSSDGGLASVPELAPDASIVFSADAAAPEACRALTSLSDAPIIALASAANDDRSRALGLLEAGADRVIAWPCSGRELEARINAAIRFSARMRSAGYWNGSAGRGANGKGLRRHGEAESRGEGGHARARSPVRKERALAQGDR